MNQSNIQTNVRHGQRGFSLVEMMIAITIGFIIVGAIGYLYLGSRQSFRTTDAMSRIQENARYALQTMAHDVRMAGYVGCGNLQSGSLKVTTIANGAPIMNATNAFLGFDSGAGAASYGGIARPAGDVIQLFAAFGGGVNLTGNLLPSNANAQVGPGNPYGFKQGDVLTVTNCINADVFKVSNAPGSSGTVTLTYGSGSNSSNRVSGTYGPDAFVMKTDQYTYFIGTNPSGGRSLYRSTLNDGTVELADNVWDMQVVYGYDSNGSTIDTADIYYSAGNVPDWTRVVSARISLLMVSAENVLSGPQTYQYFGNIATSLSAITPAAAAVDRLRLHQVFTTTVGLRNRLP
ncbi:PilW family protein [Sulfuriferula sp.]|uniref:PilW family protein n=1 Tax=Sulfuriferula sp. TaxID=2025307 RepID=UPI00272F99D2|nr:PilW family protein [Sulfuriferula sp.]MDP2026126.1 PilW family protein [Sulfuriferula sp.]